MTELFVSYSYIGRINTEVFSSFANMITSELIHPPKDEEQLEHLTDIVRKHCEKTQGMDAASVVILWWQEL